MLLRIAPDMFTNKKFNCVTVPAVLQEFARAKKFKTKYPWRTIYKKHIKPLALSQIENDSYRFYISIVKSIHDSGKINYRTGRFFDLSPPDKKIAAYTLAHNFKLSSVDDDLTDFLQQEFDKDSASPLGIINEWLKTGLIVWDDEKDAILQDWDICNEHSQPKQEIERFCSLTGYQYLGP
jgi:hypothetical protein